MSTQPKAEYVDEELSEQAVHDYLAANPDFFERHSRLLNSLELPHASGGTVSLVERQVSILRQKEIKLERQLKELIQVARENDVLAAKIHRLTLQLLTMVIAFSTGTSWGTYAVAFPLAMPLAWAVAQAQRDAAEAGWILPCSDSLGLGRRNGRHVR